MACAVALSEAGYSILAVDKNGDSAQKCVDAIHARGGTANALVAEVGREWHVEEIVDRACKLGALGGLLYAIAWEDHAGVLDISLSSVRLSLEAGPVAAFSLAQAAAVRMIASCTRGSIVFVGSLHGHLALPGCIGYNIAQAGMRQLCLSLARELTEFGIRVNMIVPGWIRTSGEAKWYTAAQLNELEGRMPLGRLGRPSDVATAVRFVVEAGYMTGSIVKVDGGLELHLGELPRVQPSEEKCDPGTV